jgi:arsenate reductase
MKLYQYPNCSTCRKAIKFLKENSVEFDSIDITVSPPSSEELKMMLQAQGTIRKLFNTSGVQYRELDMKTRLPNMSDQEAIDLLSENGKLIKRPFLIGDKIAIVGFKEEVWQDAIL